MASLHGSVGLGGRNWRPDVMRVQRLLTQAGASPGPVDGRCGRHTMQAIERFQAPFLHRPDGRVDVAGPTWRHLERVAAASLHPRLAEPKPVGPRRTVPDTPSAQSSSSPHRTSSPARSSAAARPSVVVTPTSSPPASASTGHTHADGYWRVRTPLPALGVVNRGLTCPISSQMEAMLGDPHAERTKAKLRTTHIGPLHVTGLTPAIDSLSRLLDNVRRDLPDLYPKLGSPGMLCLRNIRGRDCYSNHSWGTAIDLRTEGLLINLGETRSCKGIDALVPYFNETGWYWGGGYHHRKDCMHFECSLEMVRGFRV